MSISSVGANQVSSVEFEKNQTKRLDDETQEKSISEQQTATMKEAQLNAPQDALKQTEAGAINTPKQYMQLLSTANDSQAASETAKQQISQGYLDIKI